MKKRFSSPLIVAFEDSVLGIKDRVVGMGVLWLADLEDKVTHSVKLGSEFKVTLPA